MKLDQIAIKYGTDKSSKAHNYTRWYEEVFGHLRNESISLLEIGIQNGFSLKMWEEYFTKANIVGIDIVDCSHMNTERVLTLRGNQTDRGFMESLGEFDIIIDDGSHQSIDMKISFEIMFPRLKKGGIYVIEDLHCCYWSEFGSGNFMNYLKDLTDTVNSHGKSGYGDKTNDTEQIQYNWWEDNVQSVHLYRSIVFIKKS